MAMTETQVLIALLLLIMVAIGAAGIVIFLAARKVQNEVITKAAYAIDKFADEMEDPQKKALLTMQLVQVLGWRRIFLPNAVIGWIIDGTVIAVRKIQEKTGCPDLHPKEGNNEQNYIR